MTWTRSKRCGNHQAMFLFSVYSHMPDPAKMEKTSPAGYCRQDYCALWPNATDLHNLCPQRVHFAEKISSCSIDAVVLKYFMAACCTSLWIELCTQHRHTWPNSIQFRQWAYVRLVKRRVLDWLPANQPLRSIQVKWISCVERYLFYMMVCKH